MKWYSVRYLGFATADRRFSNAMIPWVIAEIRKGGSNQKIRLGVEDGEIKAYLLNSNNSRTDSSPLFCHPISLVSRLNISHGNVVSFAYTVRDTNVPLLYCHLFETVDPDDVMELFQSMREQSNRIVNHPGRSLSNASSLSSLIADISPSSSHFFEVLYIGRIKVLHKKVPDSFIDDALDRFRIHEEEKKNRLMQQSADGNRRGSHEYIRSNSESSNIVSVITPSAETSPEFNSVDANKTDVEKTIIQTNKQNESPPVRTRKRSGSLGSALLKKPDSINTSSSQPNDLNRTMVLLIGRHDVRLISPDTKKILLYIHLKDVTSCIQGTKHPEHFGFICREINMENYIGYVFKCQSESVADDVVGAISQATLSTCDAVRKEKQPVMSCEHCPMVWYHKLCAEVEGQSDKKTQNIILKRLELLPEEEQEIVFTKVRGADTQDQPSIREQNELMMMLLRAHCEAKQGRHVHDTAENRHEFLNQYLGGSSTIFMKAKRSLTSSFDQLLKRKGSRDDLSLSNGSIPSAGMLHKELSLPMNATLCRVSNTHSDTQHPSSNTLEVPQISLRSHSTANTGESSSASENEPETPQKVNQQQTCDKGGSMIDIFIKVGNSPKSGSSDDSGEEESGRQAGSWRQAIFNTVVTPSKNLEDGLHGGKKKAKKNRDELRSLWKKAINQQILLVRMEKENARLKAQEEVASERRIKLDYDDLASSIRDNMLVWDSITNKDARKCDPEMVRHAIRQGVPRSKRGDLWLYLAHQYCAARPPFDASKFPNYCVPYEKLLKQLTSHQHAILIDLGRTFPNHPYFSRPLGPGQLALFNLLKAYSLLDPEVGYCQGLSFVAGVLLLHMSEEQAFLMLRHLMFRRQLRSQYLPDMAALQVQLYQLSRLLHDTYPDLYAHFDQHEVNPSLYAAPWLLTFFASQFPLGFVTRVFDLIFVENGKVLFRVALALLGQHKDELLKCENFEQIMEYLKTTVPSIDKNTVDKIMKQVFNTDVSKKLLEYGVEYNVLQEEMSTPRPQTRKIKQLEDANKTLIAQNKALQEQLEIVNSNIHRLETTRSSHMMNINKLESQVRGLEVSVSTLGNFIQNIAYSHTDIEIPCEILRIVTQISNSERRKSMNQNNMLKPRGIPLKVIDDNSQNNSNIPKKNPLKPALSSPVLTNKVSNFFSNSHNQIIQQKFGMFSHNNLNKNNTENNLNNEIENGIQELSPNSDDLSIFNDTGKKKLLSLQLPEGCDIGKRLGRVLTEEDKKKLRLDKNTETYGKSNSMPAVYDKKKQLKSSQSSYELGKSESIGTINNGIHPLDTCEDVNISFGGTTKLKTFKPIKSRNSSISSNPSPSSSTGSLLIGEDINANKEIELKIVESHDLIIPKENTNNLIGEKNSINCNNNNSSTISESCEFNIEKPLGNETELLIKSQLPVKKPSGLLT
ncbi:PTB_TBC1D1_like and TBC domain-containing protein plx isoform X2 [Lycorma delicatula]|uniref:PTB_TBC1D1_like and TBC domain-containing protein plx isoform X2 n=1 Tax=Lycorma delicatula TaxID=130591 RepID=UPI003F51A53D